MELETCLAEVELETCLAEVELETCLDKVELETCLAEVEACVSSRPLTFVGDEPHSCFPLTPAHFLSSRLAGARLDVSDDAQEVTTSMLRERELDRVC